MRIICIAYLFFCSAFYVHAQHQFFEFTQYKMGTEFKIKAYAEDTVKLKATVTLAWQRIDEINHIFSDYIHDSELAIIQMHRDNFIQMSDEFYSVLMTSLQYCRYSRGFFDISVGALSRLWRRSIKMSDFPTDRKIKEALQHVGYKKLVIQNKKINIPVGMSLDFGAIAKGYAVDEAFRVLNNHGFAMALIDGGGDLYAGDVPNGKTGWEVSFSRKIGNEWKDSIMELKNCGIATSGDKYKFITDPDGDRYAHIINPITGYGIKGPLLTTVIAPNATHADALATTLSILSGKKRARFLRRWSRGFHIEQQQVIYWKY